MTSEMSAEQYKRVAEMVSRGTLPTEAIASVMEQQAEPKKAAPKPLNQMPTGKVKLGEWLHGRVPHGAVEEEYRFHPTRKWRFDFFLPHHNVAIEYEGFMTKGANVGHASISGIMRDVAKYNEAQAMGIRVFRASAENIRTGEFFELMERVLGEHDV